MARIISLVNQKGGVSKTTSSINVCAYLAALGKYVLLVDIDPQGNASSGIGVNTQTIPVNLYHSLVGGLLPEEVIRQTGLFGFDVMPAAPDLAGASIELVGEDNREFKLYELLRRIRTNYDYILIDCPPSLGLLTVNGLVAADEVIIPVQCEYYALEGISKLVNTIELVRERLNPSLDIEGVLLTMGDFRTRLTLQVIEEVRNFFQKKTFNIIVPRNIRLAEAPSFGKPICFYDPACVGSKAYLNLAQEVLKEKIEINQLTKIRS